MLEEFANIWDIWAAESHVQREPVLQAMARWQKNTRKAVSHVLLRQDMAFESAAQEICERVAEGLSPD